MRALLARHVSGAPVVNAEGELVGVLSQRDVLARCAASPRVRGAAPRVHAMRAAAGARARVTDARTAQDDAAAPPPWLPIWHALGPTWVRARPEGGTSGRRSAARGMP
jgi:CBS domain-containing protein